MFNFNAMIKAEPGAYQKKLEGNEQLFGALNNGDKYLQADKKMKKDIGTFMSVAHGCCTCLPMHYNKIATQVDMRRDARRQEFEKFY